jgi:hypothetical protein
MVNPILALFAGPGFHPLAIFRALSSLLFNLANSGLTTGFTRTSSILYAT